MSDHPLKIGLYGPERDLEDEAEAKIRLAFSRAKEQVAENPKDVIAVLQLISDLALLDVLPKLARNAVQQANRVAGVDGRA